MQAVKAVDDGLGDWIVWLRDKDNDLWMCNASAEGNVYANTLIKGDRLAGRGEEAIALMPVAYTPSALPAAEKAERVCAAAGRKVDATRLVTTVEDGVGDYIVWLQGSDHSYWLCNASADAKLYVFERDPLSDQRERRQRRLSRRLIVPVTSRTHRFGDASSIASSEPTARKCFESFSPCAW